MIKNKWVIFCSLKIIELLAAIFIPYCIGLIDKKYELLLYRPYHSIYMIWTFGMAYILITVVFAMGVWVAFQANMDLAKKIAEKIK